MFGLVGAVMQKEVDRDAESVGEHIERDLIKADLMGVMLKAGPYS